jgi:hypothetical protein
MNKDFLDIWSIVHAISGLGFGLLFFVIELQISYAIIAGFILAIGWEIFEYKNDEGESLKNSLTDIFVAGALAAGSYLVAEAVNFPATQESKLWVIIALSVYSLSVMSYWYKTYHWRPHHGITRIKK